jgi:uncharacterized protein YebE (UPF0316 family)
MEAARYRLSGVLAVIMVVVALTLAFANLIDYATIGALGVGYLIGLVAGGERVTYEVHTGE